MYETLPSFTAIPNKHNKRLILIDFCLVLLEHFSLEMVPVSEIFKNIYK